jgi:hypothetical protein
MLPEDAFLDFVTESLKGLKRDNYLLEVLVHKKYSVLHCNEKADLEFLFRKDPGKEMTTLIRKEFDALVKANPEEKHRHGLIVYSFAFRDQDTFDLIFVEGWGKRSEAVRYDVKVRDGRLLLMKHTIDLVWHM